MAVEGFDLDGVETKQDFIDALMRTVDRVLNNHDGIDPDDSDGDVAMTDALMEFLKARGLIAQCDECYRLHIVKADDLDVCPWADDYHEEDDG